MKFPPPHRGWTSGRATPSLRPNHYATRSTSNPAERHLSKRGKCSDERSHLYQQTFIDTYAKVAFAKLYDRKTPITAADLINDRVVRSMTPMR